MAYKDKVSVEDQTDKANWTKIKLYVPDLPLVYKAKKTYTLLTRIERKLAKDPLYVPVKDYIFLVSEYEKIADELVKRGWHTADGRIKARMEQRKLDKVSYQKSEAGVGEENPGSVDTGVSTANPFA